MLSVKDKDSKTHLMKKFVKELASNTWQLINGQRVQRISRLQKFEVRFSFVEEVWKCVKSGYVLSTKSKMESSIC